MFAQMKSRRNYEPCPCNNICGCHKSTKMTKREWISIGVAGIPFLLILFFVYWLGQNYKPPTRYVWVDGKMCEIKEQVDYCSTTGGCTGHDVAICP
jgi:hypothetical protein